MSTQTPRSPDLLQRQLQLLQPAVVGLALLMAFAEMRGDSFVAIFMYGLVHLAVTALLVAWLDEAERAEEELLAGGGAVRRRRKELGGLRSRLLWICLTLEAAAAIALLLGLHETDLAEVPEQAKPDFGDWYWTWGQVAFWLVFFAFRITRYVAFRKSFLRAADSGQ